MKIKKIQVKTEDKIRKPRIYFFPKEGLFNSLVNRFVRPHKEYRKLIPEILKETGIPANTKVAWTQKAGCSCGCSPGFVVDVNKNIPAFWGMEIFVDIVE